MSLNRVTIIGHLGQDPELRHLANGQAVGRFSVATDEPYTDKEGNRHERTEWHQIVVFGKVAEACEKYLGKGARYMSRAGFAHASTRRVTTAANASGPRSSRAGSNFSARRQTMRREPQRSRSRSHRRTPRFLSEG